MKKAKILVMDDDAIIRETLGLGLEKLGYDALLAEDGEKALRLYREAMMTAKPVDAVILDLVVPGSMGGRETFEELEKIDPAVKAIISSGFADDPLITHYRDYGFCGVFVKPYNIDELSATLTNVVGG